MVLSNLRLCNVHVVGPAGCGAGPGCCGENDTSDDSPVVLFELGTTFAVAQC